jgi:hypothetical protein
MDRDEEDDGGEAQLSYDLQYLHKRPPVLPPLRIHSGAAGKDFTWTEMRKTTEGREGSAQL